MRPVLAIGGADIDDAIHDQDRAVRALCGKRLNSFIMSIAPEDVCVFRTRFDRRRAMFVGLPRSRSTSLTTYLASSL